MYSRTPFSLSGLGRGTGLLGLAAAGVLALSAPLEAETLRAVKHASLRVLDPILTTATMTANHGFMIYDTLFSLDQEFVPQPQMVESWTVSDDGLIWRFTLREGLLFHDGEPVTGADVAASIARWGANDGFGQLLMRHVDSMEQDPDDPSTMVMTLTEPFALVIEALAKPSAFVPFIMPARVAATSPTEAIEEHIGSGPFRWVAEEFQPGVIAVYERNPDFIPREEPSSWAAGAKEVHFDRVEWIVMPDAQTTLSALLAGEIDFWERPPVDLMPILQADPDITVGQLNVMGDVGVLRFNVLHPPFDDVRIRRAAIAALYQRDILMAQKGNPDFFQLCAAMFVCGTPLASDAGGETLISGGDPDLARQLLEEAGYDGTPVVLLQPTDILVHSASAMVVAQALRDVGFTVDLQPMDWMSVVTRRANQGPPSDGGWSLHITSSGGTTMVSPLTNLFTGGQGLEGGWFGWGEDPELEELRMAFAQTADPDEQRRIAERIQVVVYENGFFAPLGQFFQPSAWSNRIEGVPEGPGAQFFWNVRPAG